MSAPQGSVLSSHLFIKITLRHYDYGTTRLASYEVPAHAEVSHILANLERIKELLKFVGRTARFKNTLGDSIGEVTHLEPMEG